MKKIWDISPPVSEHSAVFPGDVPFSRKWTCQLNQGHSVNLSCVTFSPHVGAHADAPSHYHSTGQSIENVPLETYLGECLVVTCQRRPLILAQDCVIPLQQKIPRVLFRTLSQPSPNIFNTDFTAFSSEAIQVLGKAGVKLIGIDTPSVDPADSKNLLAHQEIARWGILNLENLDLTSVPDGCYELIALPLRWEGAEASPVRAILREL